MSYLRSLLRKWLKCRPSSWCVGSGASRKRAKLYPPPMPYWVKGGQRGFTANYEAARADVHSELGLDATAHHPSPDPTCTDCMCLFSQTAQALPWPPVSSALQALGTQVVLPFHELWVHSWLCDLTFVDPSAWNIPLPDLPTAGSSSKS